MKSDLLRGLKAGIPIGLGYLSVSFSFGIMAVSMGFYWWQAVLISMTCVTSAGQLAGIGIMISPGQYLQMLISQLTINIRYSFMSISLSQKTDPKFKGIYRWLYGFLITDEIFGVASMEKSVSRSFMSGLYIMPYLGWTFGTLFGALLGNILPHAIMSALCLAMYGMFVAIVAPPSKEYKPLWTVVLLTLLLSAAQFYLPLLKEIPSGLAVCIVAIIAAVVGAKFFPIEEASSDE